MSELGGVIILTIFRAFSTGSRKAVDNPAPLRACELRQICLLQENRDQPLQKFPVILIKELIDITSTQKR